MEQRIEQMRKLLNCLVLEDSALLCEGKILEISKQLDNLIAIYYKKSSNEN